MTYSAFKETGFTRQQAFDDCASKGLRLANVYSEEEQIALNQIITDVGGLERGKNHVLLIWRKRIFSILAWHERRWRCRIQRRDQRHRRQPTSLLWRLAGRSTQQQTQPSKRQAHHQWKWRLCSSIWTRRMERCDLLANLVSPLKSRKRMLI